MSYPQGAPKFVPIVVHEDSGGAHFTCGSETLTLGARTVAMQGGPLEPVAITLATRRGWRFIRVETWLGPLGEEIHLALFCVPWPAHALRKKEL
jgi:hypothetical protein